MPDGCHMSWLFVIYLVALHALALPGLGMLLGLLLTAFLDATTNPLTGETKPRARGLGYLLIGLAVGALVGVGCLYLART